jgi:Fe-Mn family superoxide dismutase
MKPIHTHRLAPAALRGSRNPCSAFIQRAALHVSPPTTALPFPIEQGLPPFLSSKTAKSLAIDWQDGLLDRLNQHVKGSF